MKKLLFSLLFTIGLAHGMYRPPKERAYIRLFYLYKDGYSPWLEQNKQIHSAASLSCYIITEMEKELEQRERNIKAYRQWLAICKSPEAFQKKYLDALIAGSCLIEDGLRKISIMIKHLQELRPEIETQIIKSKL